MTDLDKALADLRAERVRVETFLEEARAVGDVTAFFAADVTRRALEIREERLAPKAAAERTTADGVAFLAGLFETAEAEYEAPAGPPASGSTASDDEDVLRALFGE